MDKIVRLRSQQEAQNLIGAQDINIKHIARQFKVKLLLRGENLKISGSASNIKKANELIEYLLSGLRSGNVGQLDSGITRSCAGKQIGPKTAGQREYVEAIRKHDYDALYDMMDPARIEKYIESGIIEVAPPGLYERQDIK